MASSAAAARRFVLLGDPVDHSVSPAIYTAAFEEMGIRATYGSQRISAPNLPEALRRLCSLGGGGNVTLPHKIRAAEILDVPTPAVRRSGACNCFWAEDGLIMGDNTDVGGLVRVLNRSRFFRLDGAHVLLLGAGGAARAVLLACEIGKVGQVWIHNRDRTRARELRGRFADSPLSVWMGPTAELRTERFDLVINATSLGLRDEDPLPLSLSDISVKVALDLVYGSHVAGTRWVRHARDHGLVADDGVSLLVEQAGLSLERWCPGVEPPLATMRRAALVALGRRPSLAPGL